MSPPKPVSAPNGAGEAAAAPVDDQDLLTTPSLLVDPKDSKDPQHFQNDWQKDANLRKEHKEMSWAIDTVQSYVNGGNVTEAQVQEAVEAWKKSYHFNSDLDQKVLGNMLGQLATVQNQEKQTRAKSVLKILPGGEKYLQAPKEEEKKSKPSDKKISEAPDGFRFNAVTLEFHAGDDALRPVPSYLTLGVFPKEGFGQNQSSTFSGSAGVQFYYKDYGFFAEVYGGDAKPLSTLNDTGGANLEDPKYNAHFGQAGIRLGMVEYGGFRAGEIGKKGHFSLFGRQKVGVGLGAGWCSSVENSDISGAKCSDSTFQLSVVNESDLLSFGYGPFEAGVRFIPMTVYINSNPNGLPDTNRLPLSFSLSYHVNPPYLPGKADSAEGLLKEHETVSDAQVTMSALNLFTGAIVNHQRSKTESAYQSTRLLAIGGIFGDPGSTSQYGLLNAGSMINGLTIGFSEGSTAYRVQRELAYGSTVQRIVLGSLLGAEFASEVIGVLATPGLPSEFEYQAGETEGITNLDARAFRKRAPVVALRDGLIVLGAVGAFGKLPEAVKGEEYHAWWFPTSHGVLFVGGLAMALTSGDGSGNSFFGKSILGNQYPPDKNLEIPGSDYDYPAQDNQFFRLTAGGMLLSYGGSGILDWGYKKYQYNSKRKQELEGVTPVEEEAKNKKPKGYKPEVNLGMVTDGQTGFMVNAQGRF